jgi:hypothetical protein
MGKIANDIPVDGSVQFRVCIGEGVHAVVAYLRTGLTKE